MRSIIRHFVREDLNSSILLILLPENCPRKYATTKMGMWVKGTPYRILREYITGIGRWTDKNHSSVNFLVAALQYPNRMLMVNVTTIRSSSSINVATL